MSESAPDAATEPGDELLLELADDYLRRCRTGEQPTVDEYVSKYPELADRIHELFPAMIAMEQPSPGATVNLAPPTERVGAIIGRYKLLEQIGEGGFGVVYMAEQQQPVRRKVAFKVVKPGMDTSQVLARFEAERQALAIMDHPNIAKVFDAGATDSGRPYFVMELIKGKPITEFCDSQHFAPRRRLDLFAQVCQAVQHAHQKGIIHRDIKPSNVLVGMHDTTPVVKVIDFGVAKALGQELTDKTLFTGMAQFLGTPLYMSPEQAGQSVLDVDTRSDIYSLGVLLYELLTGATPFDKERFKRAAQDEIFRIIREEEPPTPSTRLSSLSLGDRGGVRVSSSLASISAQRQMEPAKLTKLVRGELDWIVMKALEKDRTRRYESASGMARDIERFLQDEPVEACPPSSVYRFKKFVRRNKAKLMTASIIGAALLAAVGMFGWAVRDRSARQAKVAAQVELILTEVDQLQRDQKWPEALAVARRAEAAVAGGDVDALTARRVREQLKVLEFVDRLEQIRMDYATWVGKGFDDASANRAYDDAFREYGVAVDELAVEASIQRFTSRADLVIPVAAALDNWIVSRRTLEDDAGRKRLMAIARGIDSDPVRNRIRAASELSDNAASDDLLQLAESIDVRTQPPGTLRRLASALKRVKQRDAAIRLRRDAQAAYPGDFWNNYNLGVDLLEQKAYAESVPFLTAAVALRPNAVAALNNLGLALVAQKKFDEGVSAFRRAIEIDPKFNYGYTNLGSTLIVQDKLDEAIVILRKGIEVDPMNPNTHINLGNALGRKGKLDEAIAAFHTAIEVDPQNALNHAALGNALIAQRKLSDAVAAYRKAIELDSKDPSLQYNLGLLFTQLKQYDKAIESFHKAMELDPGVASGPHALGNTLRALKKPQEAAAAYRKAIELDPKAAVLYFSLGAVLCDDLKEYDKAIECFRKAIELDPKFANAYANLGVPLLHQNKLDEAIAVYRKAIELDPNVAMAYGNLGSGLQIQDKLDEAIAAYRKAIELDPKYTIAYGNLGEALQSQGKLEEAVTAYRKAAELDPKSAWRREVLGDCLREQKRLDEAIEAYRKAIDLEPGRTSSYVNLGKSLCELKKADEAIEVYRKAIELDPKTAARIYNDIKQMSKDEDFAVLREREDFKKLVAAVQAQRTLNERAWELATDADASQRDPTQAMALAEQAVAETPKDSDCWNTLGVARYRNGDFEGAIAALQKSRELRTKDQEWSNPFFLAMAHWRLGNQGEARTWYDKAVAWMDAAPGRSTETMKRFRAEAAELLGANGKKDSELSSTQTQ